MSDLISREALLEELRKERKGLHPFSIELLITNAPAIEQGEIAELKATIEELRYMQGVNTDYATAELQARINVLREALENLHDDIAEYQKLNNIGGYENQSMKQARQALSSTPAQLLQAHDDNLIERVITLLKDSAWDDGIIDMRVDDLIEDVRALKGK